MLDPTQGGTELCVWTSVLNDIDANNDTTCVTFNNITNTEGVKKEDED